MLDMAKNDAPRARGRPVSGRKEVVQVALDPADAGLVQEWAEDDGVSISAMGRVLMLEAIAARVKRRGKGRG